MIAKRSDHGVPTVGPLCLSHVESVTDSFGHFDLVVWIDNQRPRQLLGSTGKLRKDQYPWVLRVLSGNVFLRNQVHTVSHRRDQADGGKPI